MSQSVKSIMTLRRENAPAARDHQAPQTMLSAEIDQRHDEIGLEGAEGPRLQQVGLVGQLAARRSARPRPIPAS